MIRTEVGIFSYQFSPLVDPIVRNGFAFLPNHREDEVHVRMNQFVEQPATLTFPASLFLRRMFATDIS